MLERTKGSFIYSVQLTEKLIDQLTFREAYKVIALAVSKLIMEGRNLDTLKGSEVSGAAEELFDKVIKVRENIGESICDPKVALDSLRSPGSPQPVEAGAAVEHGEELRERYLKELDFLKIKLQIASDNLQKAIQTHTS
jgi:argininosuccinate lyase